MAGGTINVTAVDPNAVNVITVQVPGVQGTPGPVTVFTMGTVDTVPYTGTASANITGTAPNLVLNLTLPAGPGVPALGNQYDVLSKNSGTDYDTVWETPTGTGSLTRTSYVDSGDSTTLASAKSYADTQDSALGASTATANKLIRRDANGRAQVADPGAAADIATKNYTDTTFVPLSQRGAASGVVPLDSNLAAQANFFDLPYSTLAGGTRPQSGTGRMYIDSATRNLAQISNGGTVKLSRNHQGSGTAFPTSYVGDGDSYLRTDVGTGGTVFYYNSASGKWLCEQVICTSTTQPTGSVLYDGMEIYQTDTQTRYFYNATTSTWAQVASKSYVDGKATSVAPLDFASTSYTVTAADVGKCFRTAQSAAHTVTLPQDSAGIPMGSWIEFDNYWGNASISFQGDGTSHVWAPANFATTVSSGDSIVRATKTNANYWTLNGGLDLNSPTSGGQAANKNYVDAKTSLVRTPVAASRALTLNDEGLLLAPTADALTLTIPLNATTAFPIGAYVDVVVGGGGMNTATITASAGVGLWWPSGGATGGSYTVVLNQVVRIVKTSTDAWYVLNLSGDGPAPKRIVVNDKTADYTLAPLDEGNMVRGNIAGSNLNVTIPAGVFPVGARVDIGNWGTGTTTILTASGVTLVSNGNWNASSKVLTQHYQIARVVQVSNNVWLVESLTKTDTDWLTITINSGFAAYSAPTYSPSARWAGDTVFLRGAFATTGITTANTTYTVGQLPTNIPAPALGNWHAFAGTSALSTVGKLIVTPSGQVQIMTNGTLAAGYYTITNSYPVG